MTATAPTPLQRLVLAFYAFFAILFRAEVASAVFRLREARRSGLPAPGAAGPTATSTETRTSTPTSTATSIPTSTPTSTPASKPTSISTETRTSTPAVAPTPLAATPATGPGAAGREALHLLAVLQREGRLVDFVEEDLTGFPDAAVGAAARTVHEGCKRALAELFRLEPVLGDSEGALVTVERGFDPAAIRLTGSVVGEPPFRGSLRHHGWRAREVKLPPAPAGVDPAILAPAEVELP